MENSTKPWKIKIPNVCPLKIIPALQYILKTTKFLKRYYLGLWILERRMTCNPHVKMKRNTLNRRIKLLYPMFSKSPKLKLRYKLNTYTCLHKLTWKYSSQIYDIAKKTNFQLKLLLIIKAPRYMTNKT